MGSAILISSCSGINTSEQSMLNVDMGFSQNQVNSVLIELENNNNQFQSFVLTPDSNQVSLAVKPGNSIFSAEALDKNGKVIARTSKDLDISPGAVNKLSLDLSSLLPTKGIVNQDLQSKSLAGFVSTRIGLNSDAKNLSVKATGDTAYIFSITIIDGQPFSGPVTVVVE